MIFFQAVTGQDPFQIGYKTFETLVQSIEGKDVADQGKTVIVEGIPLRTRRYKAAG